MYVKVVQAVFDMKNASTSFAEGNGSALMAAPASIQTVWFPELIELGALSCRYISLDDTKSMMINMFPDEATGESVQVGREEQRKELREQHKFSSVFKVTVNFAARPGEVTPV